jgi:HSP20 family protein
MNISPNKNLFAACLNVVPASQMGDGESDWFPAVDVTEVGREYVFEVDLPGLKAEEVQVRAETDGFFISGQRVARHPGGKRLRVERPSGAFVRQLPWPPDAHGDIRAIFSDGVLELHVPKACPDTEPEQSQPAARQLEEAVP